MLGAKLALTVAIFGFENSNSIMRVRSDKMMSEEEAGGQILLCL